MKYVTNIVSHRTLLQPFFICFDSLIWEADRDGKMCYLNTSLYEPNVAIYEKLGFKLGKVGKIDDQGETMEVSPQPDVAINLVLSDGSGTPSVSQQASFQAAGIEY
jgi:hypothetical protein